MARNASACQRCGLAPITCSTNKTGSLRKRKMVSSMSVNARPDPTAHVKLRQCQKIFSDSGMVLG
jgi:heterodisulfide reductase subunit C